MLLSQGISRTDYVNGQFKYADGKSPLESSWTTSVFQYGNTTKPYASLDQLNNEVIRHFRGFGASDIEILTTRTFDYFPRWSVSDAAKGYHWQMYNIQGYNNIWFVGGGVSYESVHHVMSYNRLLIEKMTSVPTND